MQNKEIIVNSEEDIIRILQDSMNGKDVDLTTIKFGEWPKFHMHLEGEKFHQTLTPSVMKGLIELQTGVYRTYALAKYHSNHSGHLTDEEKSELEFEVKVSDGSSGVDIDFTEIASKFIEGTVGKMSGESAALLLGMFLLLYFGRSVYSTWADNKKEEKLAEIEAQTKAQEKQASLDTVRIVSSENSKTVQGLIDLAKSKDDRIAEIESHANETRTAIVRSFREADNAEIQGAVEMSGEAAAMLATTTRSSWTPVRLDDWYRVLEVHSANLAKRKIRLENCRTHQSFVAVIEHDTLDQKNLSRIQEAEWSYKKIFLTLKASELNGRLREATIIEAKEIGEDLTA